MVGMTLNDLQAPNKGQGHSFRYQSISHVRLLIDCVNSNFYSRTHRLATIHNVTDDRQTDDRRNAVAQARPLVRSASQAVETGVQRRPTLDNDSATGFIVTDTVASTARVCSGITRSQSPDCQFQCSTSVVISQRNTISLQHIRHLFIIITNNYRYSLVTFTVHLHAELYNYSNYACRSVCLYTFDNLMWCQNGQTYLQIIVIDTILYERRV